MRQQEFLINALKRFKDPMVLMRLPRIVWASIRAVKTNLNSFDHLTALWELKDLPKENIRLVQLPGRMTRDSLWTPDENAITETAHLLVSGQGIKTRRAAKNAAAETPDGKSAERVPSRAPATVEVWNASSKKGLALEVARKLRQGGFDVVKWGNYDSRQMRTFVRDHAGKTEQARAIAALLDSSRAEAARPKPTLRGHRSHHRRRLSRRTLKYVRHSDTSEPDKQAKYFNGLKRLEYRGYDSSGLAILNNGKSSSPVPSANCRTSKPCSNTDRSKDGSDSDTRAGPLTEYRRKKTPTRTPTAPAESW